MLLIYDNEALASQRTEAESEANFSRYFAFTEKVRNDGVFEAGEPLHPTETATTVRVRGADVANVDGPFAETREQLGGYYILNCESLDQALAYAAEIPAAESGSIEVRPIMQFDG
jgi:hypothetical protein